VLVDEAGSVVSESRAGLDPLDPVFVQALKASSPGPIQLTLNGEACRLHSQQIPSIQWKLVLIDKEAEALGQVRRASLTTLTLFAGTCLLACLMGFGLRALLLSPIRRLMEVQRRVAAGDTSARVTGFLGDELGELAQSFNQTADALDAANLRLRENEARLSSLFHVAPVAIGIIGLERTIVVVNDGAIAMFGYAREELIGQSTCDFYVDEEEYERVGRLVYNEVWQNGSSTAEARMRRKDGTVFEGLLSVAPQQLDDPSAGVVVVIVDITERKQTEETLRQARDEMAALNRLTRAVTSQPSLEEACGAAIHTIADVLEVEVAVLFIREGENLHLKSCGPAPWSHPISVAPVHRVGECLCGLAVQTGQPIYCLNIQEDNRCTWEECKSAGIHSFAAIPLRLGDEAMGVLGVASKTARDFEQSASLLETVADQLAISVHNARLLEQTRAYAAELETQIAQRELAEEALLKNELRLSVAISATADAVWEWNPVTQDTYFSPRWYEMLGYSDQELPMTFETMRAFAGRLDFPGRQSSVRRPFSSAWSMRKPPRS
jgi:PAS domain S-box-containing protein